MKYLLFISALFLVSCGRSTKTPPVNSSSITIYGDTTWKDTTILVYDTIHRRIIVYDDTVYKKYKVWVPVPIDSPYTVPVPIDSPYNVPNPVFVDTTIYNYHYKDSCIEDTIPIPPDTTTSLTIEWGIMQAQDNNTETKAILDNSAINIVRIPVYFDRTVNNRVADDYLKTGYKVQLNFNWKATGTAVGFPIDDAVLIKAAEAFFQYYMPYRALIPVVAVENEWDNMTSLHGSTAYHTGTVQQYLKELKIVTEIGHKYGFKIADAGITGNNLARWTYRKISSDSSAWWKSKYFVGLDNKYELMITTLDEYAKGVKDIPIDYINMHWYNKTESNGGYLIASKLWMKATGKTASINNEFGLDIHSTSLFLQTAEEIRASGAAIGIIYSGMDYEGKAIKITPEMIQQLK